MVEFLKQSHIELHNFPTLEQRISAEINLARREVDQMAKDSLMGCAFISPELRKNAFESFSGLPEYIRSRRKALESLLNIQGMHPNDDPFAMTLLIDQEYPLVFGTHGTTIMALLPLLSSTRVAVKDVCANLVRGAQMTSVQSSGLLINKIYERTVQTQDGVLIPYEDPIPAAEYLGAAMYFMNEPLRTSFTLDEVYL